MVIEAIVEKLEIKQELFADRSQAEAGRGARHQHLLAEDRGHRPAARDPGRLVGIHFFNPVAQLPLVEVVRGEQTREDEVKQGAQLRHRDQEAPAGRQELPGLPRQSRAGALHDGRRAPLREGTPRDKIDQAAVKFGMPMGPLELMDLVGLDIANMSARAWHRARHGQSAVAPGQGRQARQEDRRRLLRLGQGQAEKREESHLRPGRARALGRELVKPHARRMRARRLPTRSSPTPITSMPA